MQVCIWDDYHVFLIATVVFTRLLLAEIYHIIELPFDWLINDAVFVCLLEKWNKSYSHWLLVLLKNRNKFMQDLIIWELAEVYRGTWFRSLFYGIDGYIVSNACNFNSLDCQVRTELNLRLWKLEWKIAYFVNPFASWRSIWKQT